MSTRPWLLADVEPRPAGAGREVTSKRPWLLVDVDGVLNRMVSNSVGKRRGLRRVRVNSPDSGWTYTMHIDPADGPALLALTDVFDLAWCTTWQHEANGRIGAAAGLPRLPVVTFDLEGSDGWSKVPGILRFVAGRPFVWLDDDVTPFEQMTLAEEHGDHRIIRTDPEQGLTPAHLEHAREWAEARALWARPGD